MEKQDLLFLSEIIDRYCIPKITRQIEESKNDFEKDILIRELSRIGKIQRKMQKT